VKPEFCPIIPVAAFACLVLAMLPARADITLYSSTFGGGSGDPLSGVAVNTSGATPAQHTQYGTSNTAAWSAATRFKADGSFTHTGTVSTLNRGSATLPFTPQNGFVYTLKMTTNYAVLAPNTDWFATGFFMQNNYSGTVNAANGGTVWALTRPGSGNANGDQVAHFNLAGGAGAQGAPSASEDTSAPSTLTIVLDTTAGTGNWSATYSVGNDVLASVADLNAVDIESVGIGAGLETSAAYNNLNRFQSFELSVAGDNTAPAITALEPDEVSGVYPGAKLVVTFSENIALTGRGSILIDDITGSNDIAINLSNLSQVTVSGKTLTLTPPAPLAFATNYEVVIGPGTIQDTAGTPNAFPGTTAGQWTFTTAAQDLTAPLITLKSPLDDAGSVSPAANIVATFDDNILVGTGTLTLKDLADGSTTQVIPVSDAAQVTVSGNVLTINPTNALATGRSYAVQIAAGAVKNFSDVGFAGIPSTDDTTWNFQTMATSPNVIFVLGDDQAWHDYGFMQRPGVDRAAVQLTPSIPLNVCKTPAIDRLADEGLAFIHGYGAPVCRPALASIVTGTYLQQHWITGNDLVNGSGTVINDSTVEARMQVLNPLPRTLFNQLGYTSFQTGKWWEGHHTNGGFTQGDTANSTASGTAPPQWTGSRPSYVAARHGDWGLMTGRVDYVNDIAAPAHPIPYANTVQTVTQFINTQVAAEQPFFLWYAPFLPHNPFDAPSGLVATYTALGLNSTEANYYANIERFDGGVGAILDHLDTKGIADNTIIILICDNGRQFDLATVGKLTPYESGVRTPIIVRWPDRIKSGGAIEPGIVRTPVSMVDMVPTVHHALGLPTPPEMRGINLLDPAAVAGRAVICGSDHDHDIVQLSDPNTALESRFAIRDGWKLILFTNGNKELYHLYDGPTPVDPHETTNLAAANPQLVNELSMEIVNWWAAPNNYDSWIGDPALGITPANRDFALDPDGDGLTNGVEAWFGTDPRAFSAGLMNLAMSGMTATFTHPSNENPPGDLTGSYEWSPNLADWYAGNGVDGPGGGLTVNIVPVTAGVTTTVTATSSAAIQRLFLRARVARN
jgi:arylsulfatase A-like enzyme